MQNCAQKLADSIAHWIEVALPYSYQRIDHKIVQSKMCMRTQKQKQHTGDCKMARTEKCKWKRCLKFAMNYAYYIITFWMKQTENNNLIFQNEN